MTKPKDGYFAPAFGDVVHQISNADGDHGLVERFLNYVCRVTTDSRRRE
ncbi:hypothetical protein [Nocardia nova]|nr:hypothetical protein [Nocardia nova]